MKGVLYMNALKPLRIDFDAFELLPKEDGWRYELIDNLVMMSPRPAARHQKVSGRLFAALLAQFKGQNCDVIQELDLVLDGQYLIPDLMITCNDVFDGNRYEKVPLIVIEIISPSTASVDYITKRHKYEQLEVQEYWIVSPEEQCISVISFATNEQERYCEGNAISFVLPHIAVDLAEVFSF